MAESKLGKALENLKNNISDQIEDASSLEVTTFTGAFVYNVSEVIKSDQNKFQMEKVLKQISAKADAKLNLLAYSKISIDGDTSTIVKNGLGEEDKELLGFHKEMIEASQKSRQSIIDMIKNLAKL